MDTDPLTRAARVLRSAREVVAFTGAGVSAESGIPTFRDDDGFWNEFPVEDFATWPGVIRATLRQPKRLAQFAHAFLAPIANAAPNAAHQALADIEQHANVTIVTQNVDGLHQQAGSTIVHEIHGTCFEIVNRKGSFVTMLSRKELQRIAARVERCQRGILVMPRLLLAARRWFGVGLRGLRRPKLVLFGDAMAEPDWSDGFAAVRKCDCLLQIGCSGEVMPAAMLPGVARAVGATVIAIDPVESDADIWLEGTAAQVMPQLVAAAYRDDTDAENGVS